MYDEKMHETQRVFDSKQQQQQQIKTKLISSHLTYGGKLAVDDEGVNGGFTISPDTNTPPTPNADPGVDAVPGVFG